LKKNEYVPIKKFNPYRKITAAAFRRQAKKCQKEPVEWPKGNFLVDVKQMEQEITVAFAFQNNGCQGFLA